MPHPQKVLFNQAFIKILGTTTLFLILTPFFKSSAQEIILPEFTPTPVLTSSPTLPNISSPSASPISSPAEVEEFPFATATIRIPPPLCPSEPPAFHQFLLEISLPLCIAFIANSFVLSVSYLILKKANLIKSWRFLKYIFFVTIGQTLISLSVPFLIELVYPNPNYSYCGIIIGPFDLGILFGFIVLPGFYAYWLSGRIFNLDKKQAIFVGAIIGIVNYILYFLFNSSFFKII